MFEQSNTTNTLPLLNFSREFSWNSIEAWLLGASPVISGDTPANNVAHTYNTFLQAHGFQGQWPPASIGQNCTDQNGVRVPCPSEQERGTPSQGTRGYEPPQDGQVVPPEARNGQPSLELGVPDTGKRNLDTEDWIKRILLILAAIVIIAIAVASLR